MRGLRMIKKVLQLVMFLIVINPVLFYAANTEIILVAGFRNLGAGTEDNINIILTKSLISQLGRGNDVMIISYNKLEQTTLIKEYWHSATLDMNVIERAGLRLGANKVVFGDYKVDRAANKIVINYSVYNVQNGTVIMTRSLEGVLGLDMLDAVDALAVKAASAILGVELSLDDVVSSTVDRRMNTYRAMRNVVVPAGIALTLGAGILVNYYANQTLDSYNTSFVNFESSISATDRHVYYAEMTNAASVMQTQSALQIGFYAASGALAGLELYLIFHKPNLPQNFRIIALPNYIGFQYGF